MFRCSNESYKFKLTTTSDCSSPLIPAAAGRNRGNE